MASKIVYDQYQCKKRIKINYFHEYIQKLKPRKKKWNAKKSSNGNTVCGMPSNGTFVADTTKKICKHKSTVGNVRSQIVLDKQLMLDALNKCLHQIADFK